MRAAQDDRELVAAQAGHGVGLAVGLRTGALGTERFSRASPAVVAEGVVDVLEVVEVEQDQPDLARRGGSSPLDGLDELALEQGPAGQAGQAVDIGHALEGVLAAGQLDQWPGGGGNRW